MTILWVAVLVIYGLVVGFSDIHLLAWLFLFVTMIQDFSDGRLRQRIETLEKKVDKLEIDR